MICFVKDYEDGWLKMKLQIWDDNKLIYETPVESFDATYEKAEEMGKMKCFTTLYRKLDLEAANEIIKLIPTYDIEE